MSLSFNRIANNNNLELGVPIARDGDRIIYYIDEEIDLLREQHPEDAEAMITEMVDNAVEGLRLYNLTTKKLIDVDADVMAKDAPRDRFGKRIFSNVKEQLAMKESKFYRAIDGLQVTPQLIPNQRNAYYVFGKSGCGKSTWSSKYALEWLTVHPGGKVFIFSRKTYDPVFDDVVPGIIRVVLDRNFVRDQKGTNGEDPIIPYANSLVIFDDFLKIDDPTIKKAAEKLKNALFELGRAQGTDIISVQHKGKGGAKSMIELAECSAVVCFPKLNLGESQKVLETYLCFDKTQMMRVFDEEGKKQRWMCVIHPNIVITESYIKIL